MAENVYEGMYILDSNRYGRDSETVSGQIPEMIEGAGGQMLASRLWEERRLAYPIKGHRRGTYWLTYFRISGEKLPDIERKCRLSDTILRSLFVKVDSRIVDALVDHSLGKSKPAEPEAKPEAKPETEAADKETAEATTPEKETPPVKE